MIKGLQHSQGYVVQTRHIISMVEGMQYRSSTSSEQMRHIISMVEDFQYKTVKSSVRTRRTIVRLRVCSTEQSRNQYGRGRAVGIPDKYNQ